jgi:hypothetical protein
MADGTKSPLRDPIAEAEERLRNGFLEAIGQGAGSVRVQKKNGAGKPVVCPGYQIVNNDYDAFLEELSADYQDGGEFVIRIAGADGQVITAGSVTLAPVPASKRRQEPARQEPARTSRDDGFGDQKFLMLLMENQRMMFQSQQSSSDNMIKAIMGVMTAVITAGGNKSSDPATMLNAMIDAHQKLAPPAVSPGFDFEKAIETMARIREVFPDRDPPEGVAGIAAQFAPLIGGLLAASQQQQQPAAAQAGAPTLPAPRFAIPGQAGAPAQGNNPFAPPPPYQPAPGAAMPPPQVEQSQDDPNMIFIRLQPHVIAFQNMIANAAADGYNLADPNDFETLAQDLETFIELQVRAYMLLPDDRDYLLAMYQQNPAQLGQALAWVGITDQIHVAVIERAITLHAQSLAGDGEEAGPRGNVSDT